MTRCRVSSLSKMENRSGRFQVPTFTQGHRDQIGACGIRPFRQLLVAPLSCPDGRGLTPHCGGAACHFGAGSAI